LLVYTTQQFSMRQPQSGVREMLSEGQWLTLTNWPRARLPQGRFPLLVKRHLLAPYQLL
jgi:hypothetical protein